MQPYIPSDTEPDDVIITVNSSNSAPNTDTVASPDVSVVEALVQMGLNTLSWTVFGFDVWFTCVSKLADLAAYAIDHCGCTPALVYTTLVVPLARARGVCRAPSSVLPTRYVQSRRGKMPSQPLACARLASAS